MSNIAVRRMTHDDVEFGMRLKTEAGWNQTEADWRRFLDMEPEGCFVALLDGAPAGTVTTISYEKRFGWVGMVLVATDFRRRGAGTALLHAGIDYLDARGVETVKLDATPMGKLLYDRIGFAEECRLDRWQGTCREHSFDGVRPVEDRDADAILALDAEAFGADRSRLIRRLLTDNPGRSDVAWDGEVVGYSVTRPGTNAWHVGPAVAATPEAGANLLRAAVDRLKGRDAFVDVLRPNIDAVAALEKLDFVVQRELVRMARGPNRHRGVTDQLFAITAPEKG